MNKTTFGACVPNFRAQLVEVPKPQRVAATPEKHGLRFGAGRRGLCSSRKEIGADTKHFCGLKFSRGTRNRLYWELQIKPQKSIFCMINFTTLMEVLSVSLAGVFENTYCHLVFRIVPLLRGFPCPSKWLSTTLSG
jgi:hypothetical protein